MTFCEINLLTTAIYNKAFFKQLDYGICFSNFRDNGIIGNSFLSIRSCVIENIEPGCLDELEKITWRKLLQRRKWQCPGSVRFSKG